MTHFFLHHAVRAALLGALIAGVSGCMTTTPVYDQHFGEAVRTVRAMQTLNPDASNNTDPVAGIDGRAATAAMDRYGTQFRTPQSDPNAYVIGVGSSAGVGGMSR